jgi:type II secretory pathway pseudopilin PulG
MKQAERLILIGVAGIVLGFGAKIFTDSRTAQGLAQEERQTRQMYESAAKGIVEKSQERQWQLQRTPIQVSPPPQDWVEFCRNNSGTQACADRRKMTTGKF